MRVRFLQTVATPAGCYPAGSVTELPTLTDEMQRFVEAGAILVLPSEDVETPEQNDHVEQREGGRPFVPKLCETGIVVCIGGGPSLTQADVDLCRGRATVVAVNDAYRLAPWADVFYASDFPWWMVHWKKVCDLPGLKFSTRNVDPNLPDPSIQVLDNTGVTGLEMKRTGLRNGKNSGYAAINLAKHLGAKTIILLGYDMQRIHGKAEHWFGSHPNPLNRDSRYHEFIECYQSLPGPLRKAGVRVVNCSRSTALKVFPLVPLEDALGLTVTA